MSKRETVETELRAIWDERGRLLPEEVVEVAADEAHPLHEFFEWDDTEAGHIYRALQARILIRSVRIKVTTERADGDIDDVHIRSWVSARSAGVTVPEAGYLPEEQVRMDPAAREAFLRQMNREWRSLQRRYQDLSEFWTTVAADLPSDKAQAAS